MSTSYIDSMTSRELIEGVVELATNVTDTDRRKYFRNNRVLRAALANVYMLLDELDSDLIEEECEEDSEYS